MDMTFWKESLARRWYVVLIVTVLFAALGVAAALPHDEGAAPVATRYTAEASIYLEPQGDGITTYDNNGWIVTDARRVVVSSSVAGQVRERYGESVVITSPFWRNIELQTNISTRFVFVDAAADSQDVATDAAQAAAELAVETINERMDGVSAMLFDQATVRPGGTYAGDYGSDALTVTPAAVAASSISWGRVVGLTVVGLVVGVLLVGCWQFARRRLWSAHDVEQVLGVPVLCETAAGEHDAPATGLAVASALASAKRHDASTLAVCGFSQKDLPAGVTKSLAAGLEREVEACVVDLADPGADFDAVAQSGAVVLVVASGADKPARLREGASTLQALDVPVIGAVLVR